jgi:hypothetical protein
LYVPDIPIGNAELKVMGYRFGVFTMRREYAVPLIAKQKGVQKRIHITPIVNTYSAHLKRMPVPIDRLARYQLP